MKYWNALTDEAQETILIGGFIIEAFVLFVIMA